MPNKKRKCRHCGEYNPVEQCIKVPLGFFCSAECAAKHGKERYTKQKRQRQKKELRESREKLKSRAEHLADAQKQFNAYIRLRDYGRPCISCGKQPNFSNYIGGSGVQAGHYRSRGAHPELAFHPDNCHVQCYACNVQKSGNAIDYRINLIKKIGLERVEWLEGPHEPKKYTTEQAIRIKKIYKKKVARLKKRLRDA